MKIIRGERNRELEHRFIAQACLRSGLGTNGHDTTPFVEAAEKRLTKGAREYGDAGFWHRDVVAEIREECVDIVAWSALENVKLLEAGKKEAASRLAGFAADAVRLWHRLDRWAVTAYDGTLAESS